MRRVSLVSHGGLSRTLSLSVVARELNRHYVDGFRVSIHSKYPDLFSSSPNVFASVGLDVPPQGEVVQFKAEPWPDRHQLVSALDETDAVLGTDLRLSEFRPEVHIAPEYRSTTPSTGGRLEGKPYWLFSTGGGYDNTVSWLGRGWWQQLVNDLSGYADFPLLAHVCAREDVYRHLDLRDCIEIGGRLKLPKLIWTVSHCRGVITTGTFLAHLAAVFNKPCIVIAGGHRSRWATGYSKEVLERYGEVEQGNRWAYSKIRPHVHLEMTMPAPCPQDGACGCTHLGELGSTRRCADVRYVGPAGTKVKQAACMATLPISWVIDAARSEDFGG